MPQDPTTEPTSPTDFLPSGGGDLPWWMDPQYQNDQSNQQRYMSHNLLMNVPTDGTGTDPNTVQPPYIPGGGGGSSGLSAQQKKILEDEQFAAFREVLRRWGIPVTKNLLNLMQKAVKQQWNSTLFIDHLRHTEEYHDQFPGIHYGTGMTEATYNSQYYQYKMLAKSIGENLSRESFARDIRNGVTPAEFQSRVKAIDSIETWGPMMQYFKQTLEANGMVKRADQVTDANLMKMAQGLGPKEWETLWEQTVVQAGLERVAGITVGKPPAGWGTNDPNAKGGGSEMSTDSNWMHITRGQMLDIIKNVESLTPGFQVEDITGQQWRDIGARMRQFDPVFLRRHGVTAADLLEMELGGPRAAVIADTSQRILKEQDAYNNKPRALPQQYAQQQPKDNLPQSL